LNSNFKNNQTYNLITVLGPTASGKTILAAHIAYHLNGEIISADSRQVYKKMNIGTGKDYEDYVVRDTAIPFHLIDLVDPGYIYNVYEFQCDFLKAFDNIRQRGKKTILCGGSGMYIEAVVKGYKLINVPVNKDLRKRLKSLSMKELTSMLSSFKKLHNISDTSIRKSLLRAIEIQTYYLENPDIDFNYPEIKNLFIGVKYDRDSRRQRITERLKNRLDNRLVEEVESLLNEGVTPEQLIYYGLEYKYITLYIQNKLSCDEMFTKLNTAIHQFAKRQMTWFRRMERNGTKIHWLNGYMPLEDKVKEVLFLIKK